PTSTLSFAPSNPTSHNASPCKPPPQSSPHPFAERGLLQILHFDDSSRHQCFDKIEELENRIAAFPAKVELLADLAQRKGTAPAREENPPGSIALAPHTAAVSSQAFAKEAAEYGRQIPDLLIVAERSTAA